MPVSADCEIWASRGTDASVKKGPALGIRFRAANSVDLAIDIIICGRVLVLPFVMVPMMPAQRSVGLSRGAVSANWRANVSTARAEGASTTVGTNR